MTRSPNPTQEPPRIAVVGAGVAGSACAAGLLRAGLDVTVFDKSRGVGGRMATRRAQWADADGVTHSASFDHGCPHFMATRPRFQAAVDHAVAMGAAARWRQRVYAPFPAARVRDVVVPVPNMPAFCRHLLHGVPLQLGHAVTGLQRSASGWMLKLADERIEGPFEQLVLAIPAAQAALLLKGHHDEWADALAAVPMSPCWTLMAVTDDIDWPWDAAELERGVLARVARNDRVPGRDAAGVVPWVAHATPAWSLAHLEDDPVQVSNVLRAALGRALAGGASLRWHHVAVHRWRYAQRAQAAQGGIDHWSEPALSLAVCGDSFGDGTAEAAWCSGDDLASALVASQATSLTTVLTARAEPDEPPAAARHRRDVPLSSRSHPSTGDSLCTPLDAHS